MERMTIARVDLDSMGMRITNAAGIEAFRYDVPPSPAPRIDEPEHEGFRVRGPDEDAGYWTVDLPHQCDEWEVASSTDPAETIEQMEQFIAAAQAALMELRRRSG